MAPESRLDRLDGDMLTPVVRQVVGSPDAVITAWDCHVVKGDGSLSKRLVCRLFGEAEHQGRRSSWSVYLKVPNPTPSHYSAWHREPFQREPLLYGAGLLDDLPGGLAAPRCWGILHHADDEPWMWLEDVAGVPSLEWPLERFRVASYHFGRMQGTFLAGRPLPAYPWLDTSGWLRQQLASAAHGVPAALVRFAEHPLTRRLHTSALGRRLGRLWDAREVFADALDRMPRTLCHGDCNYTNLFARDVPDGDAETVVVDWQYAGHRQIGSDIAGLIADSSILPVRRKAAEPEEFTELILDGYLSGLKDGGWRGDPRVARFACVATLAVPWSFILLVGLDAQVLSLRLSDETRSQSQERLEEYIQRQEFLLGLADEARTLHDLIDR